MIGSCRYVFPGRNDPNRPMGEASINQVIKRIGYGGKVTGYGFRHSLSTILHENGFNPAWIEMQFAHIDKKVSEELIIMRIILKKKRQNMMQWYSDKILKEG